MARTKAPRRSNASLSGTRTALQRHVDFFDSNGDGRITLADTYSGFRRLGIGVTRSAVFGLLINAVLGPMTSKRPTFTVNTSRIHASIHRSDTGVYDAAGRFSKTRFEELFTRHDVDGDGALDEAELAGMFARNRTDLAGHLVSRTEFGLLLELAGEVRDGRRLLTRERLHDFYDGSLFYKLSRESYFGSDS